MVHYVYLYNGINGELLSVYKTANLNVTNHLWAGTLSCHLRGGIFSRRNVGGLVWGKFSRLEWVNI